jgi:pilus assembly protein CpaC
MTIAQAYSKDVINLLEVGGEHQVMLEVVIAEMSRTIGRELGSNWSVVTDGGSVEIMSLLNNVAESASLVGSIAAGGAFWDIFLELLEEKGLGKVLAEPTLVARSGESASFLAGGEVPILIPQGSNNNAITLEYKEFGVGLIFEPIVLGPDRISLNVSTQVSELDANLGISFAGIRVPAFVSRRASTTIELADGHSFAIAGLLKDDVKNSVSQYPWLGELPIIGAAFRSSEFQRSETELVILVTPHLAKPVAPGPRPRLPTDYYIEPSSWEFYVFGALEGRFWDRDDRPTADAGEMVVHSDSSREDTDRGGLIGGSGLRMRGGVVDEPATASESDVGLIPRWGTLKADDDSVEESSE